MDVGVGFGVGKSVETGELSAPERAQDHFSAAMSANLNPASRVADTDYTNTNATALLVLVGVESTTGAGSAVLRIGGTDRVIFTQGGITVDKQTLPLLVAPGEVYRLSLTAGWAIWGWFERTL